MTIKDALKTMNQSNGNHLDKIYIPSLGRDVFFKPLSTADAKTLTRISFLDQFDVNTEVIKLALFDKLCTEIDSLSKTELVDEEGHKYPPLTSETLTEPDYLAFLCGIRQLLETDVSFNFTCQNKECNHKWDYTIKVDQIFGDLLKNFKRKTVMFEKEDEKTGNIWKFELTDFNMIDYFYFRYTILKIKEQDPTSPEVLFEGKYVRPILYIKNIWLNDEKIEDWEKLYLHEKLKFYNQISPNITINPKGTNTDTVFECIQKNFIEEQIEKRMYNYTIQCPECKREYKGVFEIENFFTF